ncbi:unnamed protein product [Mytilus coruscus]|uniref:Endonuclease/exonuclease/phosphatase domain-containing protein n=1 Tax=Mytilus coruscus TaxID=42192 RepID=A0A6J8CN25_MYTCO|nr:unnamed protein product [Mytilus coruscus]
MSMSDTSRLIKESRRIVDASNDVNLNSGALLNMILEIVTGIDSTMRRMKTSMEKRLDDLKQDFLTVSDRVRTLENQASDFKKLSDCETSCQGVSNLFDQVNGQVKTNRRTINNHDMRIKKLEEKSIVQPIVPPVIESKEIESLKAAILDLQYRSMKNNLIFTGLHRVPDVIFGCVYVPTENSKYSTIEAFEELENELNILTNTENCYVALVGDFNSKTGSLPDYIIPDESVVSMFDLDCDADILEYLYDFENLTQNKISLQRVSQCTCRPNKYGHRLLELCRKNNLYIANSRVGSDKDIGEKTCNDSSVVDYLIISSMFFPMIFYIEIADFIPLYSDCHSFIHFRLHVTFSKSDSIVTENSSDKNFVRWKSEQKSEYVGRIHNDPEGILVTVINKLDELSVNNDETQNDINNIVLDISKNFKNAAAETFGKIKKHKHFYKHENSKPWFNRKCSMSRKKFHKARKRYSFLKNAETRRKMRQASKEHKITLNKSFANYQQKAADELRSIS